MIYIACFVLNLSQRSICFVNVILPSFCGLRYQKCWVLMLGGVLNR